MILPFGPVNDAEPRVNSQVAQAALVQHGHAVRLDIEEDGVETASFDEHEIDIFLG